MQTPQAMSVLRHPYRFAVRWSSGEVEGARIEARTLDDAVQLLQVELRARSAAEPALGRPRLVEPCLLNRQELDHVELDWRRAG